MPQENLSLRAYLTGFALAKNAISSGHESAILDDGLSASSKGSRVFAALERND